MTWYPKGGDSFWINPAGDDVKEKLKKPRQEQTDWSQTNNFEEKMNSNNFGNLV